MKGPKTHHTNDIWQYYVKNLLANNPDWTTGWNKDTSLQHRKNYYIYRPYDKFDEKLRYKKVEVINFGVFKEVVEDLFERAKHAIIRGEVLNLYNKMGRIHMVRIQRNFKKKSVDFYKTKKYPLIQDPVTGIIKREHIVYFTDDEYCRVAWSKSRMIANQVFYRFRPTKNLSSGKGFNQQIHQALTENKRLKYKYLFKPLINYKKDAV